jgi:hypothetical protein
MEKLFNIPVELFRLDKLMINKQKVCRVNFAITDTRGDKNEVFTGQVEPNYQCTEELQLKLDELKPYLCDICHIETEERSKVNIVGVEVTGDGKTATFKIHGVQLSESEQAMRFSTCKIRYDGGFYGFEADVTEVIKELQGLAHGYIFEGQKAVLTLGLANATIIDEQDEEKDE